MAKPKKPKSDDQKAEGSASGVVVQHQKLCLSVDMDNKRIYGYTELRIVAQESQHVALHADNMKIIKITVDGEEAEFEYFPHDQVMEGDSRFSSVSSSVSAADVAGSMYISSLEKELVPNLIVPLKANQQESQETERDIVQNGFLGHEANGYHSNTEDKNAVVVHIDYLVERAETGVHFAKNVLYTDNQIRRAHCWFPCMDSSTQRSTFDIEITVDSNFVAVSNGNLLYQVLSKDDPPRKTYVYKLTTSVHAKWISLIVAPFEVLPDNHNDIISHLCLSSNVSDLQNTVGFFHNAFSHYEDYLSTTFPLGSYKQIFISAEVMVSSFSLGASTCAFSSNALFDDKIIDQTIETRVKLAYALAKQWFGIFVSAEEPTDDWLLDGLAGFLTDTYIKRFLGNNEARYRRYKANYAVCKADVTGATALSSPAASSDLYGTHSIGPYGKIRNWKSITVLQMLEKQMGPDSFRKILQLIVKGTDSSRPLRSLGTKEFRHLANKVGNLERPFLKEFFPRWVESYGCPILKMGLSYNKRRNSVELAVHRDCTVKPGSISSANSDNEIRDADIGWPGMMSIRVHELDGMYDHPVLPMAGESWQLLEIQCHSKLAAKRFQKPKKGSKPDGSDDNGDANLAQDMRTGIDSPLLWVRVDPELEYLAEIEFHQPVQMWINQLEKDKDVVAQSQAVSVLERLPQLSFAVANALNNFLNDPKAFWRVRIEAAYALANVTSEETDLAGLHHLVKFYKSRRFDTDIGLPRPNDFRDFPEYFVLKAIPRAVASVRAADGKSPREAIEFVYKLLKYNDNNGNPYSDVYWLAALVESVGELEFGQQGVPFLSSLLKRIDRIIQFDSLMPSHNGTLTVSCIRTLAQIAQKMSNYISLDRVRDLITPFRKLKMPWEVQMEASKSLLDLEFHFKGLDAALALFMTFVEEEYSLRGETKLAAHVVRLCQDITEPAIGNNVDFTTLVGLLRLLSSKKAFNNIRLRHHLFCILQILAGRTPTLYGVPKPQALPTVDVDAHKEKLTKPTSFKLKISKPQEQNVDVLHSVPSPVIETVDDDTVSKILKDAVTVSQTVEEPDALSYPVLELDDDVPETGEPDTGFRTLEPGSVPNTGGEPESIFKTVKEPDAVSNVMVDLDSAPKTSMERNIVPNTMKEPNTVPKTVKEPDTVSTCSERRSNILKIRVKRPTSYSKADDQPMDYSRGGINDNEVGPCSSVSVDAPARAHDPLLSNNQNNEDVNSSHDRESRMTSSICSAKLTAKEELGKELQCTADSRFDAQRRGHGYPPVFTAEDIPADITAPPTVETRSNVGGPEDTRKKKDKDKKRRREEKKDKKNDPEYLERKRLKKEKKKMEKVAKKQNVISSSEINDLGVAGGKMATPTVEPKRFEKSEEISASKASDATQGSTLPRVRIKFRPRNVENS